MAPHRRTGDTYELQTGDAQQFADQGCLVLPNVISEAEIVELEKWFDHFVLGNERHQMARDFCDMSQPYGTPFEAFQLINAMLPSTYRPELAHNVLHRVAQDITDQLYSGGRAAVDYEQFLAKKPSEPGAEFAMHQDLGYWPKTPNTWTATFSLAITSSDLKNGCLQVIPGSNTEPDLRSHMPKPFKTNVDHTPGNGRDESHLLVIAANSDDEILHLPVERGSVTVHDERIVHGSSGNQSTQWRKTYVMAFRDIETIRAERAAGFTHSHNDTVNWDDFIT